MYLAERTRHRLLVGFALAAIYVLVVSVVAWVSRAPGEPFGKAFLFWLLGVPVCLAAYATLELSGEKFLYLSFWNRMSSVSRVLLLVAIVALLLVLSVALNGWLHG
jgi:uncharacterized membrane protein